jgi:hypothetical protein
MDAMDKSPSEDEKRYWTTKIIIEAVKLAVWFVWTTIVRR